MNDDLKKMLYDNNEIDGDKNFVDPNDLVNVTVQTINDASTIVNTQNGISNNNINIIDSNNNLENSVPKKNKKLISLPVLIFIIIGIIMIVGLLAYDYIKDRNSKEKPVVNENTNDTSTIVKEDIEEDNTYGYAILSYKPENSFNEYYRIVELNRNGVDNIVASYDISIKDAVEKVRSIDTYSAKIVNDKFYYLLNYNLTSNGISTYNILMCIDLTEEIKTPVEVFDWKQDIENVKKVIKDYKVTYDYIYFSTNDSSLFYKYNITSEKIEESNEEEFNKINEKEDTKFKRLKVPKLYYKDKEIYIDSNKRLIYDGKEVYSSSAVGLTLYYSFNGDVVISEGYDCENISCDTIKYYKINLDTLTKQELDYNSYQIFSQIVWHK